MTVCLIFLDPILYFFGASADTLPYARDYMKVILYGNLITHIYMGLNEVMRASGYPQRAMMATLFAVLINGVLNALFIFVFWIWESRELPWGRSVPSFWLCSGVLYHFFQSEKVLFVFKKKGIFKVRWHIVGGMLAIGLSPFLMNLCSCLIVLLINNGLKDFGEICISELMGSSTVLCFCSS